MLKRVLRKSRWLMVLVAIFVSAACQTLLPDEKPALRPDVAWLLDADALSHEITPDWWNAFGSGQLQALVQRGLQDNPDLRISAERLYQAELEVNIAGASLWPGVGFTAQTGGSRSRSEGDEWQSTDNSRVGVQASYQIDLWGRLAAERLAVDALLDATRFDHDAARLELVSTIAASWFNWLGLQERLATARENIRIAERILAIVDARFRFGTASSADLARQKGNLLAQESAVLPLALQARQTRAALATLIGAPPHALALDKEHLLDITLPEIWAGIPSDLLTRRPDIASMEAQLAMANADVMAARAALLPGLELGASAGRSSAARWALTAPVDTVGWSLSLAQTLFDHGRRRHLVNISKSRRVALVEQYRKVILNALQETELAVDQVLTFEQQEHLQQEIIDHAQRALRLTEIRYQEGNENLLALLEAQRGLFQAQDQQIQLRQARLNALVDLFRVLGGGWDADREAGEYQEG